MLRLLVQQLREEIYTARAWVCLGSVILVFAASSYVSVRDVESVQEATASLREKALKRIQDVETLNDLIVADFYLLKEPPPLFFIAEGAMPWLDDNAIIEVEFGDPIRFGQLGAVKRKAGQLAPDWVTLTYLVVSFLTLVMSYDSISRERERGVLALVLSTGVSRAHFVIATIGSRVLLMICSLLCGVVSAMAVQALAGTIAFGWEILWACLGFLAAATLFVAVVATAAVAVSSASDSSRHSLAILITAWAAATYVVPQTAYLVASARGGRAVEVRREQSRISLDTFWSVQEKGLSPRERAEAGRDDFAREQSYLEFVTKRERQMESIREAGYWQERSLYALLWHIGLVSPSGCLKAIVEEIVGTSVAGFDRFPSDVARTRRELRHVALEAVDGRGPLIRGYWSEPVDLSGRLPEILRGGAGIGERLNRMVLPTCVLAVEFMLATLLALRGIRRMVVF